ncbi:MAG: DUF1929 domain-containing protein, partial [Actinobacteria bacterium]|nr:DUF1929 domain-containing protein [Actinomycetota bacterium]
MALVFVAGGHLMAPEATLEGVHEVLEPAALAGCGAAGVLAGEREIEDGTAVAVWAAALDGGTAQAFHARTQRAASGVAVSGLPALDGASCALLLPDGRVFVAGGEDNDHSYAHQFGNNQSSFELYEPPYCHQGDRPTITSLDGGDRPDDELGYGDQVRIQSPQAPEIDSVVLMRLGSATHHTDSEQRHVPMNFALTGEDLI